MGLLSKNTGDYPRGVVVYSQDGCYLHGRQRNWITVCLDRVPAHRAKAFGLVSPPRKRCRGELNNTFHSWLKFVNSIRQVGRVERFSDLRHLASRSVTVPLNAGAVAGSCLRFL